MNDLIKEQLSALLDGELPRNETELLLRRLERDGEPIQEQCARYLLIGEAMRARGARGPSRDFTSKVRAAVDATEPLAAPAAAPSRSAARWLRPLAGAGIAAGVAAVAILGLRVDAPEQPVAASSIPAPSMPTADIDEPAARGRAPTPSYVVPVDLGSDAPLAATRLTNYVVAHSEYSSPLGRRNVLTGLLSDNAVKAALPVNEATTHDLVDRPR